MEQTNFFGNDLKYQDFKALGNEYLGLGRSLYGVEYTPPKNIQPRDPMHTALERLIGIDLANGRMSIHDQADVGHHIQAIPENAP